ncbi:hypothetical protein P7K49_013618 [Saguinus oedipus]|uniref:CFAP65 fourth Ig-like domain-containing protein n=1 Tax=Saguinus oedipus TaxID=9490 RepID=A0ABQ9VGE8_SAGOE|nr:hypothetical protein P7K49_013618 [Saguinus oedipus]
MARDQAFSCPTAHGVVLPGEKKCVSVYFHPKTLDTRTMDYFSIVPSGCASKTLLKVVGFCGGTGDPRGLPRGVCCPLVVLWGIICNYLENSSPTDTRLRWSSAQPARALGLCSLAQRAPPPISGTFSNILGEADTPSPVPGPAVSLQRYCVDFSWVNLGERSEQALWIENQSDCTAHFQFAIDCLESVFSIRPAFGTLVGKARMTLRCAFQPTHPIICFRRVACLIHHQVSSGEGVRLSGERLPRAQR